MRLPRLRFTAKAIVTRILLPGSLVLGAVLLSWAGRTPREPAVPVRSEGRPTPIIEADRPDERETHHPEENGPELPRPPTPSRTLPGPMPRPPTPSKLVPESSAPEPE